MKKRLGKTARPYIRLAAVAAAVLILCGLLAVFTDYAKISGIIGVFGGVVIFVTTIIWENIKYRQADSNIKTAIQSGSAEHRDVMDSLPVPIVATHADGTVKWYNERFSALFEYREMHDSVLDTILTGIKWSDILRAGEGLSREITIGKRQYDLVSRLVKDKSSQKADEHSVYLYLIDKTEILNAVKAYEDERTDVAVICIDNYDELFQRMNDSEQQTVSSALRTIINNWAVESHAVLKKIDRDRYFMFFEHKYLDGYIENKFDILEKIRKTGESVKQPVSVSIGIGTGSDLSDNDQAARTALEMAQGRGGDQVGIKDDTQYHFYGGKNREYEKSTRVKTRAVASALTDYIKGADNVIFVGHKNADYDCFGAAMGLQRAVREFGKNPYIIHDSHSPAIQKLYDEILKNPEYDKMFIDPQAALEYVTDSTLVVVLDTHRPAMLQSEAVVSKASKVVLIDHHRRSTEFIQNCSLIYHEPYASSTCEMVTEILQYMSIGSAVTAFEAECLYTGILLDTKNFIVKTGVRTFEAASYLRRLGLNTIDVKKLFNVNKNEYDRRAEIVRTAVEVAPNFSVAYTTHSWPNIRVIASQAADEMLNINSVSASFVVYPDEGRTCVSARSVSDVNVHVIMEALGGGGHATVAGVQREDVTIDRMLEMLKAAINDYIKNKN